MGRALLSLVLMSAAVTGLFQYEDLPFVDMLEEPCQVIATPCQTPPRIPYPRTDHSAVLYTTWSQSHAGLLCPDTKCGPTCIEENANCSSTVKRIVPEPDGKTDSIGNVYSKFCPEICCDSENCLRTRDALGETVPLDEEVMLVFGGRAFRNVTIAGIPLYNNCTNDNRVRALEQGHKAAYVNSCGMELLNELWRYHVGEKKWTYLKPTINRLISANYTSPTPRFGQACVMVEIESLDEATKQPVLRKYMYMYGGNALECPSECGDFWRYEIPWASQRYYPQPDESIYWNRGNYWEEIKLQYNPGPRMYHEMTVSKDYNYIYLFGGIYNATMMDDLWRYSVKDNLWEKLVTEGVESVHRQARLWDGSEIVITVPLEQFSTNDSFSFSESGSKPSPRISPSLFYFRAKDDFLILYGGYGKRVKPLADGFDIPESKADMWAYSIELRRWVLVVPREQSPQPRYYTKMLQYDPTHFAVFSGASLENFWPDFWIFSTEANSFVEMGQSIEAIGGVLPKPRKGHISLFTSSGILIYGGTIGTNVNISSSDTDYQSLQVFESQCGPFLRTYNLSVSDLGQPSFQEEQMQLYEETNNTCFLWNKTFPEPIGTDTYETGVWLLNFTTCIANCSGNGQCLTSVCVCDKGFYGPLCEQQECPNSVCVPHTDYTYEKRCFHCSGKGTCVDGTCVCQSGFRGLDCSMQDCPNKCAGLGTCISSYPFAKCKCPENSIGDDCSRFACLNSCNAPYGTCNGTSGKCTCVENHYGDDCSIYVIPSAGRLAAVLGGVAVLW